MMQFVLSPLLRGGQGVWQCSLKNLDAIVANDANDAMQSKSKNAMQTLQLMQFEKWDH